MRGEAGRVGDWEASPPNSPFHRTRDVPMTRETHPATFSVPDGYPLNCWWRRRSRGARLLAAHD